MTTFQTAFADTEAAVAHVLRAALVAPVYGRLPARVTFPCVRLWRLSGGPVSTLPLYLDEVFIQLDVFAERKHDVRQLADTARAVLSVVSNTITPFGTLTGVRLGGDSYEPDETFTPPKERYRCDLTAWARATTP